MTRTMRIRVRQLCFTARFQRVICQKSARPQFGQQQRAHYWLQRHSANDHRWVLGSNSPCGRDEFKRLVKTGCFPPFSAAAALEVVLLNSPSQRPTAGFFTQGRRWPRGFQVGRGPPRFARRTEEVSLRPPPTSSSARETVARPRSPSTYGPQRQHQPHPLRRASKQGKSSGCRCRCTCLLRCRQYSAGAGLPHCMLLGVFELLLVQLPCRLESFLSLLSSVPSRFPPSHAGALGGMHVQRSIGGTSLCSILGSVPEVPPWRLRGKDRYRAVVCACARAYACVQAQMPCVYQWQVTCRLQLCRTDRGLTQLSSFF